MLGSIWGSDSLWWVGTRKGPPEGDPLSAGGDQALISFFSSEPEVSTLRAP